jgi:cell division protein FtsQ
LRAFWLIGLFFCALLGVGVYKLFLWPGFHIARIEANGAHMVTREEVVRKAAFDADVNLWLQNARAAERRVEIIPYVATARVHRGFPASVRIDIVERRPDGCVQAENGERFTVDGEGRVLEAECERVSAPLYRVPGIREALEPGTFLRSPRLARLQSDAHGLERLEPGTFLAFTLDGFDQFEAIMGSGVVVRFGADADLASKARLVAPILAATAERAREIKTVDVRAIAAPVVEYKQSRRAQD